MEKNFEMVTTHCLALFGFKAGNKKLGKYLLMADKFNELDLIIYTPCYFNLVLTFGIQVPFQPTSGVANCFLSRDKHLSPFYDPVSVISEDKNVKLTSTYCEVPMMKRSSRSISK